MNTVTTMTDGELLRQYARERSETAFAELVNRHINLVYSAALRQAPDSGHAQDITQTVFTNLALKAGSLIHHPSLAGWLFTSVRFTASTARRNQMRREQREREAINTLMNAPEPQPDWTQIRPLLDETLCALEREDREAVLLRHLEDRSYAEIGQRLGLSENAARMRVSRALGRLHTELSRKGVTSTEAALAVALAANAALAAPTGLAPAVTQSALAAATAGFGLSALLARLLFSKAAVAIIALVGAVVVLKVAVSRRDNATASSVTSTSPLSTTATELKDQPKSDAAHATALGITHRVKWTNGYSVHLTIITADSGKPIPSVPLEVRGWRGENFFKDHLVSDRFGKCDVNYPRDATELELTTQKDAFADTQLLWNPTPANPVPTNYLLKLDRGVTIGGTVLDPDGNPVAGAEVGFNHEDRPETLTLPQNHRFGWVTAKTDTTGHWTMTRIGENMILDIYGSASHEDYVGSSMVSASAKDVERQLRSGQMIFRLGRARTVEGIVVDETGSPVVGAKVTIGRTDYSGSRHGKTGNNGKFVIKGCELNERLVTAKVSGYAATTIETNLDSLVQLTMKRGRTLQLHVLDTAGTPMAKAWVCYEHFDRPLMNPSLPSEHAPASTQVAFDGRTDKQGNLIWNDAPIGPLRFIVEAHGHYRSDFDVEANAVEKTFTVVPALTIHGTVRDATTGQPIPKFQLVLGSADWDPTDNSTNARWSTFGRDWINFENGTYSKTMDGLSVYDADKVGCFVKFVADGHAPFVSRLLRPNEGDVELDALLQPAASVTVTVFGPDGRPERSVDVGLVSSGARLNLQPGGFSWQNLQSPGSLKKTDASGQFVLLPDDAVTRVIAASADGFADATPQQLAADPNIHLQAWGSLQITCQSNGIPVAAAEYRVDLVNSALETVSFQLFKSQKTDQQGRITFSPVPPGSQRLIRVHSEHHGNSGSMHDGPAQTVDIPAGQTAELTVENQPF